MGDKVRYVTRRADKKGERWYWQRKGFPLTRLPDDPAQRTLKAAELNAKADARHATREPPEGSIGWVIAKYKASDDFNDLAPGTTKYYKRYLGEVEDLGATLPFRLLDRRMVIDFIEGYDELHDRRKAAAVLRNLFEVALYHQVADVNHAAALRLKTLKPRDRWWTPEEIAAWFRAAPEHPKGRAVAMAFCLLFYTAQRPNDVLKMAWTSWDRARCSITLRQQKTQKLVEVAAHPRLQEVLAQAWPDATCTTIVEHARAPLSYTQFLQAFVEIRTAAGVADDAQPRDLRRTAVLAMAEGGATEAQIAAVTGHSIEHTRQILETYIPRTLALAQEGVSRMRALVGQG